MEFSAVFSRLYSVSETPPDALPLDALWSYSPITRKVAATVSPRWIVERHEQAIDCPGLIFATVQCQHRYNAGKETTL